MSIEQHASDDGKDVRIRIKGRFDFEQHQDFRAAYRATAGTGVRYTVDLSQTEYMDSSALGMLLLLREHAGGEFSDVTIAGASEGVRKVLDIANFGRLFRIQ
ncbi:anti-anti-sigma factor [Thioalkalivibrio versutus]|uniref:Anti-anti-sigma factor n=1 Tax=Thioalkalivibrio versutus TaxID=106634 RepID=A0A0G3FYA1_9GAMM|nr:MULTISPECIES: STAS domain-containing protein [Thioalkalivibrio]AKJ93953.1 anti-anti-sigma factor [Thioalkalivibrio versutus]